MLCVIEQVQRVFRGFSRRAYTVALRSDYDRATRALQRVGRGFVGRRRATRARAQRNAALRIQTNARGAAARARVSDMRDADRAATAATAVQAVLRMAAGVSRARTRRALVAAVSEAVRAADGLTGIDVAELAGFDDAPNAVTELVRCLAIMTAPMPVPISEVNAIPTDDDGHMASSGKFSFITAAKRNGALCARVAGCRQCMDE